MDNDERKELFQKFLAECKESDVKFSGFMYRYAYGQWSILYANGVQTGWYTSMVAAVTYETERLRKDRQNQELSKLEEQVGELLEFIRNVKKEINK